ncbi:MAG: helix-turn-helix transcriptional regulator [Candidatus Gallimonas sp.]
MDEEELRREPENDDYDEPQPDGENASDESQDEKSISSDLIRGHINTIILRALYDGDKYGYEIIADIERKSHGQYSMKQPSLYSALKRLEKEGYITSYWGGSVSGGRRKYFSLTDAGKEISERNQAEWEYSRTVIDSLISEKDFDFSTPAPTAVNMRMLRSTTSRVPARSDGDEAFEERVTDEQERAKEELERERARFEEERARLEEESLSRETAAAEELERLRAQLNETQELLDRERRSAEESERERQTAEEAAVRNETEARERERLLREDRERLRAELNEAQQRLDEERENSDRLSALNEEERNRAQAELSARDAERESACERYDALAEKYEKAVADAQAARAAQERAVAEAQEARRIDLKAREQAFAEAQEAHRKELEEQEKRIREEEARYYASREKQILHENYLRLVNTPPASETSDRGEYDYYSAPVASDSQKNVEETAERKYKTVVNRLYSNAVRNEEPAEEPVKEKQAVGRIDFRDLEAKAAQDGIRINTAGGAVSEERSDKLVQKGKALFLCAVVVFLICLAEGSVALALLDKLSLPLFYPYFIWGAGLALLLVTGVAFANRYGANSLRKTSRMPVVNAIVAYALLVIIDLVFALAMKIDFTSPSQLATYVLIPLAFCLNIVVFAIVYVAQMRSAK